MAGMSQRSHIIWVFLLGSLFFTVGGRTGGLEETERRLKNKRAPGLFSPGAPHALRRLLFALSSLGHASRHVAKAVLHVRANAKARHEYLLDAGKAPNATVLGPL